MLDIGAGGGAASLPLAPPAGLLIAVDESQAMLDVFAQGAERRGARHTEIAGRWPDVAPNTPGTDVVVCHHVVYNVSDLAPFLAALNDHARRRVIVELTDRHPQSDLSPLWKFIHGIDRPSGPTAADAAEVAASLGYDVHIERFAGPSLWNDAPRDERVVFRAPPSVRGSRIRHRHRRLSRPDVRDGPPAGHAVVGPPTLIPGVHRPPRPRRGVHPRMDPMPPRGA